MTSWNPNDDIETQADMIDQAVEVIIVIVIAMLCIAGLAYGPDVIRAIGL